MARTVRPSERLRTAVVRAIDRDVLSQGTGLHRDWNAGRDKIECEKGRLIFVFGDCRIADGHAPDRVIPGPQSVSSACTAPVTGDVDVRRNRISEDTRGGSARP